MSGELVVFLKELIFGLEGILFLDLFLFFVIGVLGCELVVEGLFDDFFFVLFFLGVLVSLLSFFSVLFIFGFNFFGFGVVCCCFWDFCDFWEFLCWMFLDGK